MSTYFFNLADGTREPDLEGTEFATLQAARIEAISFAGALAKERAASIWADGSLQVEVTDETGTALLLVTVLVTNAAAAVDLGPQQ